MSKIRIYFIVLIFVVFVILIFRKNENNVNYQIVNISNNELSFFNNVEKNWIQRKPYQESLESAFLNRINLDAGLDDVISYLSGSGMWDENSTMREINQFFVKRTTARGGRLWGAISKKVIYFNSRHKIAYIVSTDGNTVRFYRQTRKTFDRYSEMSIYEKRSNYNENH